MLLSWVPLAKVAVRVISEGLTGDDPLPSSLMWLSAMFSFSCVFGRRHFRYLLAMAWRPRLSLCYGPVHWLLTTRQLTSFLQNDGQRERERAEHGSQSFCNPVSELTSCHSCHVLFIRGESSSHSRGRDCTNS